MTIFVHTFGSVKAGIPNQRACRRACATDRATNDLEVASSRSRQRSEARATDFTRQEFQCQKNFRVEVRGKGREGKGVELFFWCQLARVAARMDDMVHESEQLRFGAPLGALGQRREEVAMWHGLPPTCMTGSSVTEIEVLIGRLFSKPLHPGQVKVDDWLQQWQIDDRGVTGSCKSSA